MIAASLALSIFIGHLLVSAAWPAGQGRWEARLAGGALAVGAGLGVSSLAFFLWLVLGGYRAGTWALAAIEAAILAAVLVARRSLLAGRADILPPQLPPAVMINRALCGTLLAATGISFAMATWAFLCAASLEPHGGWDAWAIWNLKARFFFRDPSAWRELLAAREIPWANLDYPLLLPGIVARSWHYLRGESLLAPAAVSYLFMAATAGLLFCALSLLRGREYGALGALSLVATPFFITHSASQYADVPLGLYFLAPVVLFAAADAFPAGKARLTALAGFMAGLAVWTKNEGALFLVVLTAARAIAIIIDEGPSAVPRRLAPFCAGAALPVLVFAYFKLFLAPPNKDFVRASGAELIARLTDAQRYRTVWSYYGKVARHLGFVMTGTISVLIGFLVLAGVSFSKTAFKRAGTAIVTALLMIAGYFFVYCLTGLDLRWHIETTIKRLAIQLWPLIIFAFFMAAKAPPSPEGAHRGRTQERSKR